MNVCSVTPIGPVVRKLFALLDEQEIAWAVLRGSDGLPDDTRYDIDILVASADLKRAESLVEKTAASCGWRKLRIVNKYQYRCWLLISPEPEPRFLPIDLFGGCCHRFFPFAEAKYALEHRRRNVNGVWIVPPGFGAWVALAKELMRHDTFKENSRAEVKHAAIDDGDNFMAAATPYLGADLTTRLLEACQKDDWEAVGNLAAQIRRKIGSHRIRRFPAAVMFFWKNLVHHLNPPMSMFVVLLGPDGAGKSSVAEQASGHLYHRPFKVCKNYEYNFRLLPQLKMAKVALGRLLGKKIQIKPPSPAGTKGSGMNKEHGSLRAMAYVLYYSMDLILGRFILQKYKGQGALVIFARYYYDYYYQKGYRNVPGWFLSLLEYLVPSPDLILYLHRDAGEIYAGKPELDLAEIQVQQRRITTLISGRKNALIIDASGGLEKTTRQVTNAIISKLLAKKMLINPANEPAAAQDSGN